jgi:hypothetical protein
MPRLAAPKAEKGDVGYGCGWWLAAWGLECSAESAQIPDIGIALCLP